MQALKNVTAEHLTNDKIKTSLIKNVISHFPPINSGQELKNIEEKLASDELYYLSYANYITSRIDKTVGYKSGMKQAMKFMFSREFLLQCYWKTSKSDVTNIQLKETALIKILLGNYFL